MLLQPNTSSGERSMLIERSKYMAAPPTTGEAKLLASLGVSGCGSNLGTAVWSLAGWMANAFAGCCVVQMPHIGDHCLARGIPRNTEC
jgi:hypothetical protein